MTDGSSNLTAEQTDEMGERYEDENERPMRFVTVQSGDPQSANRAERRRALRKQRLKGNGERRQWS